MLLGTDVAQLTVAPSGTLSQFAQDIQHFLAAFSEFAGAFAFLKLLDREVVEFFPNQPAAAVTAIVVDEKRRKDLPYQTR